MNAVRAGDMMHEMLLFSLASEISHELNQTIIKFGVKRGGVV